MLRPVTMFRVRRCGSVFCHWASCTCRMNCSCSGVSFSRVGSMRWASGACPLLALRGSPAPGAAILPLLSPKSRGAEFAGNSSLWPPQGSLGAVVHVFLFFFLTYRARLSALDGRGRREEAVFSDWLSGPRPLAREKTAERSRLWRDLRFPRTRGEDKHTNGRTNPECGRRQWRGAEGTGLRVQRAFCVSRKVSENERACESQTGLSQ